MQLLGASPPYLLYLLNRRQCVRQGQTGLSIGRVSPDRPLLTWMCGPEVYEFSGLSGIRINFILVKIFNL